MKQCLRIGKFIQLVSLVLGLSTGYAYSSYAPPYNDFKLPSNHGVVKHYAVVGAGTGTALAAIASTTLLPGGLIGGTMGALHGLYKISRYNIIAQLNEQNVQVVEYRDTVTVIIPTDKFFVFDSGEINDLQYAALFNIVKLVFSLPHGPVYVAGFTDNVGSKRHKKQLSLQRAHALAGFLWAYNLDVFCIEAAGYADKNDIAQNAIIHGSAMNRRVEIQWKVLSKQTQPWLHHD